MAISVGASDVRALELGTALLGSGGGGPLPAVGDLLRSVLDRHGPVSLVPVDAVGAGSSVVPVGIMGSSSALTEVLLSGTEFSAAITAMSERSGRRPDFLMPFEGAGVNGLIGCFVASVTGLDLVDCDLMGRALPRLDQISTVAAGTELGAAAVASPSGSSALLHAASPARLERMLRSLLPEMGGWAAVALPPLAGEQLAGSVVAATLSRALALGRALEQAEREHRGDPATVVDVLAEATSASVLARGRVDAVARSTAGGNALVRDHRAGSVLRLELANEYLLAIRDGALVAETPDIITCVDARSMRVIGCDELRVGSDVALLRWAAPPFWDVPAHRRLVDAAAFGLATTRPAELR
ncbi:DUF917 domain-containing protein [Pseudonocardia sp. MH-G8]|uniref:DUF917 domain-containing protein n=1 Tax=Pseudonocardia sp. MH-G8 TaxID=1854588 RepID=UPI000B9FD46E|nr:DUF917 domain-containing protein [Pseudonocardia sp. MH-G8]OZM77971.1 hypothetical protein CFP66_33455 [Pseudonocardia sp. MH-G8]